uniref:Uncharacterized protein n=1 Tax=Panagrolaimus sp. ES5 TaxID=591445 RepID=A0AC34FKF4_9BILA
MSIEVDFGTSPSSNQLSPLSAETSSYNPFNYLRQRNTTKRAPFNLLTIKNAIITQKFLQKWRQATNGYKTTVIHVTFENCDFSNLEAKDVCNFIFGYIRAISVKIEGDVNTFLEEFFEDDRIQKLQNVRIICDKNINLDDKILLNRIFRPGNLQVLELRKILLSELFVNKFIQQFRESSRLTRCINRLFFGGECPWPLHQINFQKQLLKSADREKYRFENRFGYYSLNIEYSCVKLIYANYLFKENFNY